MEVRKIDNPDKEPLHVCMFCGESSESLYRKYFVEISSTMKPRYICDDCADKLKALL